jgi:membrane fusion protein, multidrug efflux system
MRYVSAFLLLALAGCTERVSHADAARGAEKILKVETITVAERPVAQHLTLTGSLAANRRSMVASDGTGKALATFVERGAYVRAGEPLVRLDTRGAVLSRAEAHAQVAAARTLSERARADCARAEGLFAQEAISRADHDRMMAECRAAAAQAEAATARESLAGKALGDAVVRAPFAGVIDERSVTIGEYVRTGQPVATIVEIDPLRLELTVPESSVASVREGQEVAFEVAAFPDEVFRGTIRHLGGSMRRASRDLVVEAVVANPERRLRPGMFAVARVAIGVAPLPVIPLAAVRLGGEHPRVYAVQGGRLEERLVQLGRPEGDEVAVLAGVRPGDRLVTGELAELRDGLRVE